MLLFFPTEQNVTNLDQVPEKLRAVYGEEYFANFIECVDKVSKPSDAQKIGDMPSVSSRGSPSSRASSGYSSASSTLSTPVSDKSSVKEKVVDIKTSETMKLTETTTAPLNLSNTNRILHALVEAATSTSPKVRYFVGSFQDRMLKSLVSLLPTVVMDTYLTCGQISKVVPKLIKEKME